MDFETPEQAIDALDNVAKSMDSYPAMASLADMQRRAVAFLRESLGGAPVATKSTRSKRG